MKNNKTIASILAVVMMVTVSSPAFAYDHWGHHRGERFGLIGLGVAAVAATAAILTMPFVAVANAVPAQPYYAPPPAYYPPQSQAYYPPQPQAYYAPPVYYAPQPVYYARPAYYAPAGYYR